MPTVIDCGVDWYGASSVDWLPNRVLAISDLIAAYQEHRNDISPLNPMYRQGYTGLGDGYFFVGQREDGWYREVKSHFADLLWKECYMVGDHVARLDLQVTILNDFTPEQIIETHTNEALLSADSMPEARRRTVTTYKDNKGGSTLYVGSRSSEQFGRIYNKGAQSEDKKYANAVRYEVEFKNKAASTYAHMLNDAAEDYHDRICSYVRDWFVARDVLMPKVSTTDDYTPVRLDSIKTDRERTYQWMRKSVAPAINRMLRTESPNDIVSALGLDFLTIGWEGKYPEWKEE